jgi:protein-tyrosine phosphatase
VIINVAGEVESPLTKEQEEEKEYVHEDWNHHSIIVKDLHGLVAPLGEHIKDGKQVLVHCQEGECRAATVAIAYVLFLDPSKTVQEACDIVKSGSKWINPTIHFWAQLEVFRDQLRERKKRGSQKNQTCTSKNHLLLMLFSLRTAGFNK